MLKILKYGLIGWLVLSVLTAPLYWPYARMVWVFMPFIEKPKFDPPADLVEARQQDLDYLTTLTRYDRAFDDGEKRAFDTAIEAIRPRVADMSDADFYLSMAEAVALADNGHTNISYGPQYREFETIGARLYRFSDGLYVVEAAPDHETALGRRVTAIEGRSTRDVQQNLQAYRGGNAVWRSLYSTLIIEAPALLHAAGLAASAAAVTLDFETPSGDPEQLAFEPRALPNGDKVPGRSAWETLIPGGASTGHGPWAHTFSGRTDDLPRYLKASGDVLSYVMEGNGLYIRALPGIGSKERPIAKTYKTLLAPYTEGSLDYLVVDFRLHDGGDYTRSMAFAKNAPEMVKETGKVYIITGPNTFSSGIVTVAMLKYYAGDKALIVGEPMGDREQFWAERGTDFRLPNSGYYVNYATGYHDWEKGCKGERYCFTMNVKHEVPAGSLAPNVLLTQTFDSYRQGEDVVMDWIASQR